MLSQLRSANVEAFFARSSTDSRRCIGIVVDGYYFSNSTSQSPDALLALESFIRNKVASRYGIPSSEVYVPDDSRFFFYPDPFDAFKRGHIRSETYLDKTRRYLRFVEELGWTVVTSLFKRQNGVWAASKEDLKLADTVAEITQPHSRAPVARSSGKTTLSDIFVVTGDGDHMVTLRSRVNAHANRWCVVLREHTSSVLASKDLLAWGVDTERLLVFDLATATSDRHARSASRSTPSVRREGFTPHESFGMVSASSTPSGKNTGANLLALLHKGSSGSASSLFGVATQQGPSPASSSRQSTPSSFMEREQCLAGTKLETSSSSSCVASCRGSLSSDPVECCQGDRCAEGGRHAVMIDVFEQGPPTAQRSVRPVACVPSCFLVENRGKSLAIRFAKARRHRHGANSSVPFEFVLCDIPTCPGTEECSLKAHVIAGCTISRFPPLAEIADCPSASAPPEKIRNVGKSGGGPAAGPPAASHPPSIHTTLSKANLGDDVDDREDDDDDIVYDTTAQAFPVIDDEDSEEEPDADDWASCEAATRQKQQQQQRVPVALPATTPSPPKSHDDNKGECNDAAVTLELKKREMFPITVMRGEGTNRIVLRNRIAAAVLGNAAPLPPPTVVFRVSANNPAAYEIAPLWGVVSSGQEVVINISPSSIGQNLCDFADFFTVTTHLAPAAGPPRGAA